MTFGQSVYLLSVSACGHCSSPRIMSGEEGLEACVEGGQKADRKNIHSAMHFLW